MRRCIRRRKHHEKDWQEQLPLNHIRDIKTVSGGDVNEAFKVTTEDDVYFLLVQRNRDKSFYVEIGLNAFEEAGVTPHVIDSGEINGDAFLILSYLDEGTTGSQRELGQLVAKMHSRNNLTANLDLIYLMKVEIFHLIILGLIRGLKSLSNVVWII